MSITILTIAICLIGTWITTTIFSLVDDEDAPEAMTDEVEETMIAAGPLDIPVMHQPLTEDQIISCIVRAGCLGTVKLTYESGSYEIDRTTNNADKLVKEIERAHGIGLAHNVELRDRPQAAGPA